MFFYMLSQPQVIFVKKCPLNENNWIRWIKENQIWDYVECSFLVCSWVFARNVKFWCYHFKRKHWFDCIDLIAGKKLGRKKQKTYLEYRLRVYVCLSVWLTVSCLDNRSSTVIYYYSIVIYPHSFRELFIDFRIWDKYKLQCGHKNK